MSIPAIKCVIVGDDTVGKTSLLISFTTNKFPSGHRPSTFGGYTAHHTFDGTHVCLALFDSTGAEEYDRLRPLLYPQTDVVIICFSVVNQNSYEHVRTKWAPELAYHRPRTPVLVVGTKSDLREDSRTVEMLRDRNTAPIQFHQGLAMYKDIGADAYLECSALTSLGVNAVFKEAMRLALSPSRRRRTRATEKRTCIIA